MFRNLSTRTKLMTIAGFIIALIVIPLTIIQVQKQQQIRQHAAAIDSVSFNLSPQTAKGKAGESFNADVHLLNKSEEDISSVDVTIPYDSSILGAYFQPNNAAGYTTIINETKDNAIHYVAVNSSRYPITESDLTLGTLILTGKADGKGKVGLENVQVTASGNSEKLAIDTSAGGTLERQYIIGNISSSPTVSSPAPSPALFSTIITPALTKPQLWECHRYHYDNSSDCSGLIRFEPNDYLGCQAEDLSQNQGCVGTNGVSEKIVCYYNRGNCVSSASPTSAIVSSPLISASPSPTPDTSQIYNQCYKICDQGALVSETFDKPACILECDGKYRELALTITSAAPSPSPSISPIPTLALISQIPMPTYPSLATITAAKDEKPIIEVRASPDKADAGEEISLIVLGSDDLGVKSLERKTGDKKILWFIKTGENWESFDCDNQKLCTNTWKITEAKKGKYSYCFKTIDSSNQVSESKCAEVSIEPKEAGKNYPPIVKLEASPKEPSVTDEISLKVTATDEGNGIKSISINLRDKDQLYQTYECPAKSESCSKTWKVREGVENTYSYIAFAADNSGQKSKAAELDVLVKPLKGSVEEKKYQEELASGKLACPQENFCVDAGECGWSGGKELTSYACKDEPASSSFPNRPISGSLPAVCCQIEKNEPKPAETALINLIGETLIPSFDMEIKATEKHYAPPDTKSALGMIFGPYSYAYYASTALHLNMESWMLKFRDEPKLREMDKQKRLYTYLKSELERGKTLDDVVNSYSRYVDANGDLTKEVKNRLDKKYNNFLQAFSEDCASNRLPQDDCTPERRVNSQKAAYVLESFEEDIIKILGKPSRDPILVSLLRMEDRLNQGNLNAEDNANLLFNIAELFDSWNATGIARFYYAKTVSLLEYKEQTGSPLYELASQRLKVLELSRPREIMFDITMMMASPDMVLPFYPVGMLFVKPIGLLVKRHGFEAAVSALTKEIPVERKAAETYVRLMSKLESAKQLTKKEIAELNGAAKEIVNKMESMGLFGPESQRGFINNGKLLKKGPNPTNVEEAIERIIKKTGMQKRAFVESLVKSGISEDAFVDIYRNGLTASKKSLNEIYNGKVIEDIESLGKGTEINNEYKKTILALKERGLSGEKVGALELKTKDFDEFRKLPGQSLEDLNKVMEKNLGSQTRVLIKNNKIIQHVNTLSKKAYDVPGDGNLIDAFQAAWNQEFAKLGIPPEKRSLVINIKGSASYAADANGKIIWDSVSDLDVYFFVDDAVADKLPLLIGDFIKKEVAGKLPSISSKVSDGQYFVKKASSINLQTSYRTDRFELLYNPFTPYFGSETSLDAMNKFLSQMSPENLIDNLYAEYKSIYESATIDYLIYAKAFKRFSQLAERRGDRKLKQQMLRLYQGGGTAGGTSHLFQPSDEVSGIIKEDISHIFEDIVQK